MVTVQRLYHTLPAQSTPSSAFIGHPPTTAVTAYISITKNENSYAIEINSNVELGDDQEVVGQHGTGVVHRGQLLQSGITFATYPCAWCRCGGSARLAAGHAHTLREGGQRGLPATATLLACAGGCSRLWLSAFAYTVSPTPVSVCIQAWRESARHGGGADGMGYRGAPARPRADDSAFAEPRSPAPSARGGASGRGCAALTSGSCLRWW